MVITLFKAQATIIKVIKYNAKIKIMSKSISMYVLVQVQVRAGNHIKQWQEKLNICGLEIFSFQSKPRSP